MMQYKRSFYAGQEAIEFVLISALVFFAAIFSFILLGDKLGSFFHNDSAVSKVASTKASTINANSSLKYQPTFSTYADNNPSDPYGLSEIIASQSAEADTGGLTDMVSAQSLESIIQALPDDIQQTIKTTGVSQATSEVSDKLAMIASNINIMAAEYPDDPELQKLSDVAYKIADTGHLIADCEEWFELAAERLHSDKSLHVSEDNRICEHGNYKGDGSCDTSVSDKYFLFKNSARNSITKNLNRETDKIVAFNKELQAMASNLSNPEYQALIKQSTDTINTLSAQIKDISDNVKKQSDEMYDEYKKYKELREQNYLEALKSGIASKTTDYKSTIIKHHSDYLKMQEAKKQLESEQTDTSSAQPVVDESAAAI
jgi:hypothetical protein